MTERVPHSLPNTHQFPQVDISKEAVGEGIKKELRIGIGVMLAMGASYAVDYTLKNPEETRQLINRVFEILK